MKNIIISADGDRIVYNVPNKVADNLDEYCIKFCTTWIHTSPDAEKYRLKDVVCYNEADFIEYLNKWVFPNEPSFFVDNLGHNDEISLPEKYADCPEFCF